MKIVLAGSVSFSRHTLERLLAHGANVAGVLGLDPSASNGVSDYSNLEEVAAAANVPYRSYVKINAPEIVEQVRAWAPDLMFVVGLSQLVHDDIMNIPPMGSIGFHPTRLPEGRGRAPVAWLTWDAKPGAATFFVLEKEADAGAIFVQEPYDVPHGSYAEDVIAAVRAAIDRGLDRWLPKLLAGEWNPVPQDEALASFWGKRAAEDGWIDWMKPADEIARLVRTASHPYPGAYTYLRGRKLMIWRARVVDLPFRGVPGRVLHTDSEGFLVQTGDGVLKVEQHELTGDAPGRVAVGMRLGFVVEDEIAKLRERLAVIEEKLGSHDATGKPPKAAKDL
ncbi:MAG TPA: methionyl-tRNA formyltransferase [Thermoanaerobaculia bacterium]|nr:methionyl-tRNA formyltransferase [Thermoanaerobaculia bacterium]